VTVTVVGDMPVASADSYSTPANTSLTVDAPGVLGNDIDAEGHALQAVLVGDVSHGTLTLNTDGGFTYTPAGNFSGADSFTYTATNGTADSNIVTVSLTVTVMPDVD
jgi:VCBS repeat-containing protein